MGNLALHLIKGQPAVHSDDDLIVSHIAITIANGNMDTVRERLKFMGINFRTNVSVPNPGTGSRPVDQVIVGIEFLIIKSISCLSFQYHHYYSNIYPLPRRLFGTQMDITLNFVIVDHLKNTWHLKLKKLQS